MVTLAKIVFGKARKSILKDLWVLPQNRASIGKAQKSVKINLHKENNGLIWKLDFKQ